MSNTKETGAWSEEDLAVAETMNVPKAVREKDPLRFWVPPAKNGIPATARIESSLKTEIATIVQSGITPYKTEGDLVRAALWWFVNEILGPGMGTRTGRFTRKYKRRHQLLVAVQEELIAKKGTEFVGGMVAAIDGLLKVGEIELASAKFGVLWREIDLEEEPTRSRLFGMLWTYDQLDPVRIRWMRKHGLDPNRVPEPHKAPPEPGVEFEGESE